MEFNTKWVDLTPFQIFGDTTVGRMFVPDGLSYKGIKAEVISPIHGRSIAIQVKEYEWILVKGGGWNYKGPQIYISNKDEELIFGLYPLVAGERELAVSREIEKISNDFPKVLYYKKFSDYDLPKEYECLKNLKFRNGNPVDPCLLYTMVKCPYRVADLMYLTSEKKRAVIESCCDYWGVSTKEYIQQFIKKLSYHVAILHKNNFVNDTLEYSNVTMLAEIVDYEWVTVPNIPYVDGTVNMELIDARREKELLYAAEVCLQLSALLGNDYNFFNIYSDIVSEYKRHNPGFIEKMPLIKKILNREKIII